MIQSVKPGVVRKGFGFLCIFSIFEYIYDMS